MRNEMDEILLSQLADGELESDQVNDVLLDVLDDEGARDRLKEHLRMRQSLKDWRRQEPQRPVVAVEGRRGKGRLLRLPRRLGALAAAALIGGALVIGGFWVGSGFRNPGRSENGSGRRTAPSVTSDQMTQLARAFEFYESVAGPLRWYAADEQNIQVAAAGGTAPAARPVAVVLRLDPVGRAEASRKTYAIVCRNNQPATIELPNFGGGQTSLRLFLVPVVSNGAIRMHYTIAMSGPKPDQDVAAALTGRRNVGLGDTPLGQLALEDGMVNVHASAWAIREDVN